MPARLRIPLPCPDLPELVLSCIAAANAHDGANLQARSSGRGGIAAAVAGWPPGIAVTLAHASAPTAARTANCTSRWLAAGKRGRLGGGAPGQQVRRGPGAAARRRARHPHGSGAGAWEEGGLGLRCWLPCVCGAKCRGVGGFSANADGEHHGRDHWLAAAPRRVRAPRRLGPPPASVALRGDGGDRQPLAQPVHRGHRLGAPGEEPPPPLRVSLPASSTWLACTLAAAPSFPTCCLPAAPMPPTAHPPVPLSLPLSLPLPAPARPSPPELGRHRRQRLGHAPL